VIDGCRPLLSPHFNLTVEIPLKAIVRGYSYAVLPISWRNRKRGQSSLRIEEMGSRYLYIVLNVWLEKLLTKGDYRRPAGEGFVPWAETEGPSEKNASEAAEAKR
jgi:dolichol-phosphate mannosyltransferase